MSKFIFSNEPIAENNTLFSVEYDVRSVTPENNFCCKAKARVINDIYTDVQHVNTVWQPDVLMEAKKLAEKQSNQTIIDIGCGNGDKLIHYFPESTHETVGVDFHNSIHIARTNYPARQWLECDLTSHADMCSISERDEFKRPAVFILSDVIEHLPDVRPILSWLRELLLNNPSNRLILSTPDRLRQGYLNPLEKPKNAAHVREWSLEELTKLLICAGFQIIRKGHTRANQFDTKNSTLFFEIACSKEHYYNFLSNIGLIRNGVKPKHLLVTTEYANFKTSGGIGTFLQEQRKAYGYESTLCLFAGPTQAQDSEALAALTLVPSSTLLAEDILKNLPLEDQILHAVKQILFFLPTIETVQYGDYQGIGCRVAQAKKSGILPTQLLTIAHCHGATHYLENANKSWFGISHFGVAEKEKLSIELADLVTFPTEFLRYLYSQAGILVHEQNSRLIRYPYHHEISQLKISTGIDTVIFFGKQSTMKGYDLFIKTLIECPAEKWKSLGIKNICFIGPRIQENPQIATQLRALSENFNVEELLQLDMACAMDAIYERAHRSICVMPYLADNHPYALLDATFSTALPIMIHAGGVAEMYPWHFQEALLAAPDAASLREKIFNILKLTPPALQQLRASFLDAMVHAQEGINERYMAALSCTPAGMPAKSITNASIVVPVFNTGLEYIKDLAFSLNNQTLKPKEVIFVDDASTSDYFSNFSATVSEHLKLPYKIVRHDINRGLSAARNTGLSHCNTEYIINVDSDDVPLPNFVRNIVQALDKNLSAVAAVPYLKAFDDGEDFNIQPRNAYTYRPLGEGVIASQLDNLLGHANAGFRVTTLREFGGWDETSKSMWEDYALYLRLVSAGRKIMIIPEVECLYRVREKSMLRTYDIWPAMQRLPGNMLGLPRYEHFRLQAAMRCYRDAVNRVGELQLEKAEMQLQLNRKSIRVTRYILSRAEKYPRLLKFIGRLAKIRGRRTH